MVGQLESLTGQFKQLNEAYRNYVSNKVNINSDFF